jgi:hypothetical protein
MEQHVKILAFGPEKLGELGKGLGEGIVHEARGVAFVSLRDNLDVIGDKSLFGVITWCSA